MLQDGEIKCTVSHAELVTVNGCVHKGPCLITGIVVGDNAVNGVANLYDGENALGRHKFHIAVLAHTSFSWPIVHPVDFDDGIYITVGAATTHVTVCYIPLSRSQSA